MKLLITLLIKKLKKHDTEKLSDFIGMSSLELIDILERLKGLNQ